MKITEKGPDEPEAAVVAAIHGDEPCGRKAVERFLEEDQEFQKGVKFVIANEKALEKEERFIDTDLNRCFPGNNESSQHEERLAADLLEELEGLKVLVLHSMEKFEEVFSLVNGNEKHLLKATGVEKTVNVEPLGEGSIEKYLEAVSVETGEKGSEQAVENSYKVMKNFLAYFDVIDERSQDKMPELFEMYEKVSGDFEFLAENFQRVEKGEKYAENQEEELRADEVFYPILMSSEGYEDILGFKGRRIREDDSSFSRHEKSAGRRPENELKSER